LRCIKLVNALDHWVVEPAPIKHGDLLDNMDVCIKSNGYSWTGSVPLVGTFQLDNIAIACTLAEIWVSENLPNLSKQEFGAALVRGIQATRWPGRFEQISTDPPVIIDVGHSPDACSRFAESIKTFLPGRRILLVTGVSANKAVEEILQILTPTAHGVICTRAHHNGENVQRIQEHVRRIRPTIDVREAPTIEDAVEMARKIASSEKMTVVVAGGLFLAVEFRTAWVGGNPRMLRFL
jgi:dihydrofolate synthase/folylpolyglutamate synthase